MFEKMNAASNASSSLETLMVLPSFIYYQNRLATRYNLTKKVVPLSSSKKEEQSEGAQAVCFMGRFPTLRDG